MIFARRLCPTSSSDFHLYYLGHVEQRLDLRSEGKAPAGRSPVVERLHAERVARQQQPAPARLPEGENKHPVQPVQRIAAPCDQRFQQHFGVAVRAEAVPLGFEFGANLDEVVDLAVEHQHRAGFGIHHRLRASLAEVDDADAVVAECDTSSGAEVGVRTVGPAMANRRHHGRERSR